MCESVPPQCYGGTERIVSYLTEELVWQGHDVTLFASGDSETSARLIALTPRAQRSAGCVDPLPEHLVMIEEVYRRDHEFDVIHFHIDYLHFPISRREQRLHVTTLHGRLDLPDLVGLYRAFPDMPVITISDAQAAALPSITAQGTVYHGLPEQLYELEESPGDYLAFIGRISPEKRLDRAIEIAARSGLPLRVAAKLDRKDERYYHDVIAPLLPHRDVELVGEICDRDKQDFLGRARALVFPIDWPEPFGLVMIEAMACGTPVVAFRCGSVPEVIEHGVTGFICDTVDEMVTAVGRVSELSRATCRQRFEQRFTARRMTDDYVHLYHQLIARGHDAREQAEPAGLHHPGHELARR